jgi:arylsulfatase A-like enzyme
MYKRFAFCLALFLGSVTLASAEKTAAKVDQPNIIWLMAEDMGIDLECYGMAGVKTPNLNQMAREGALYRNAYCSNPICSPNRSAMMVGVDQTRIDAQHHRSNRDKPLAAPFKPITAFLRDVGYACLLGHDQVLANGTKIDCNFKYEDTGPYDGETQFGIFDKKANFTAADQPFFSQIQLKVTHRGDWWADVREKSKHPVSVDDVQLPPYMADTPEIRLDWATYLDTVEYMDDEVGVLMQSLKDQGLDQNTVVVFIADNGRCNVRGKGYLQQPGIHIPMIIWAPGRVEPGTIVDDMVCTTDISATVLHLAGANRPDYMTAKPLMGVDEPQSRTFIRSARDVWDEIDECSRSVTTRHYKYIRNHMPEVPNDAGQAYLDINRPAVHVMRRLKAEGKLTAAEMTFFQDRKPKEELYDLTADPDEMNNLAGNADYDSVLKKMRAHEAQWTSQNDDFGLQDIGNRQPEPNMPSVATRTWIQENRPELWARLESGELMKTQAWGKMRPKQPKQKKSGNEPAVTK